MTFKPEAEEEIRLCRDLGISNSDMVTRVDFTVRPGHLVTATVEIIVPDEVASRIFARGWNNKRVTIDPVPRGEL